MPGHSPLLQVPCFSHSYYVLYVCWLTIWATTIALVWEDHLSICSASVLYFQVKRLQPLVCSLVHNCIIPPGLLWGYYDLGERFRFSALCNKYSMVPESPVGISTHVLCKLFVQASSWAIIAYELPSAIALSNSARQRPSSGPKRERSGSVLILNLHSAFFVFH